MMNKKNGKYENNIIINIFISIFVSIFSIYFIISRLENYKNNLNNKNLEGFNGRPGAKSELIKNTNEMLDNEQKQLLNTGGIKIKNDKYIDSLSNKIMDKITRDLSKKGLFDISIKTGYSDKGNKCVGESICSPITGHKCKVHLNNKRDPNTGKIATEEQFCKRLLDGVSHIQVNSNTVKYELLQSLKQLLNHIESIKDNQSKTINELIKDRTISEDMLRQQTFFESTNNKLIDMKNKTKEENINKIETITDDNNIDREHYSKIKEKRNNYELLTLRFERYLKYILIMLTVIIILNASQMFIKN